LSFRLKSGRASPKSPQPLNHERPDMDPPWIDGPPEPREFDLIDYAECADAIRAALNRPDLGAVLSNRINIILGALDKACSEE